MKHLAHNKKEFNERFEKLVKITIICGFNIDGWKIRSKAEK